MAPMSTEIETLIRAHREGFAPGHTPITYEGESDVAGVDFGILVQSADAILDEKVTKETVWVLLDGAAHVVYESPDGDQHRDVARTSLFDEAPATLHVAAGTRARIEPRSQRVEWAVVRVTNDRAFAPRLFAPEDVAPEYRGDGLAQGTCLRNVRLIFDRNARPESNLVIGEVVNYPGRWSSYPPHHHAQPEIYHYRFTSPQGYGHGEVGESVYKVRHHDTLRIPGGYDHAQAAAPGYGMYYLWIVRHLDGDPYAGFEFAPEHAWLLDPHATIWTPKDGPFPGR
jgi:5-deoxy-glucuronate isomerase